DLIATRLARNHRVVVASADYLKRNGKPQALADLSRHNCLVTASDEGLHDTWTFKDGARHVAIKAGGRLHCNDGEVLTRWALAGHGLAWRSTWEVADEIEKGRLVEVLAKYAAPSNDIHAVYADRQHLPAKVKLFIEFLKETYGDPPYWERRR
ncbi:MAG TPA: substrate binding domain-containing protein, partial [Usitatibacteraceae bacterium]|nr:substrate binding domain-containing protein [Usitatibacteraceae bacterium]